MSSIGFIWSRVKTSYYKDGNEIPGANKAGEFLDYLNDY